MSPPAEADQFCFSLHGHELVIDRSRITTAGPPIETQIDAYANGDRRSFDVTITYPDGLLGTVLRELVEIPYGETRTYAAVASQCDTAPVAVGTMCGQNPLPLFVPCHRVVGTNGSGGFSAAGGVEQKRSLLQFEAATAGVDRQTTFESFL